MFRGLIKLKGGFLYGTPEVEIPKTVAPQEDDLLIYKNRISSFVGTDLEIVLRGQGVRNIVLTGIATSGVVLSTLRQAVDMDYAVTVLEDLCSDHDAEVQRVLMEKIFPTISKVEKAEGWVASL